MGSLTRTHTHTHMHTHAHTYYTCDTPVCTHTYTHVYMRCVCRHEHTLAYARAQMHTCTHIHTHTHTHVHTLDSADPVCIGLARSCGAVCISKASDWPGDSWGVDLSRPPIGRASLRSIPSCGAPSPTFHSSAVAGVRTAVMCHSCDVSQLSKYRRSHQMFSLLVLLY